MELIFLWYMQEKCERVRLEPYELREGGQPK